MAEYNERYGATRKKKKKRSMLGPLAFVLLCVAVLFGMGIFFRVETIEVQGAASYTPEEVIEASGIEVGDNLFFINRSSASSRIFSRLPFVEAASIDRQFPKTVVITVEESFAVAYVDWQGQSWMMTGGCKMLGAGSWDQLEGLIHVVNLTPVAPAAGEPLAVDEGESLNLSYLKELLQQMQATGVAGDVSEIDMQNAASPAFEYLDRFTVKMGPSENTDYKLRMLISAVAQMQPDVAGTIDLSDGSAVHFTQG